MSWDINPGSTWKPLTDLNKTEIRRLYDALDKSSTREEREAVLRRTIHYPPEYETVFANLIRRSHRTFEDKDNDCHSAKYKTECYKKLKHVLNEFHGGLFTDSGKPLRFTLKRRSPAAAIATTPTPTTATATATATSKSPQRHSSVPLQPLNSNYILYMPDWKIKRFAEMISERNTDEKKTRFIQKYLHVTDEDGDPFIGLLNDIIVDILHISNYDDDLTTESKIKRIFDHLLHLKNTTYPEVIHVLYPFPAMHPTAFRNGRRNPRVHNLGGGMRRRKQRTKKARKLR